MPIYVNSYTLTSALGTGIGALRQSLRQNRQCLTDDRWSNSDVDCHFGRVELPPDIEVAPDHDCRNNRLVELAIRQDGLEQAVADIQEELRPGRCALVMGTSTSGIDRTELAYRDLDSDGHFTTRYWQPEVHNPYSPGGYAAARLGIRGPTLTVSAACASSAKVFAVAKRWLQLDLVDAVVVAGADSLCLSVIHGFHSLQLVSPSACKPFDVNRDGISLGEAAGFVLLSRERAPGALQLKGVGESCDAHHMSSAHPDGLGARLAMQAAVEDGGLDLADVDYVNLHGTGTRANDDIEGRVCSELLAESTVASATKGWTGHALGAAGIIESVLCLETLATDLIAGTRNTRAPQAEFNLLLANEKRRVDTVLTNSFGFGGSNCSVVFGR